VASHSVYPRVRKDQSSLHYAHDAHKCSRVGLARLRLLAMRPGGRAIRQKVFLAGLCLMAAVNGNQKNKSLLFEHWICVNSVDR
jgi:hypothetical protein